LALRAADQRHRGHLGEARRTAERMLALALLGVARCPRQALAHLALSEAYNQAAKNAWQTRDRATIELNWHLALDAALQALAIDPGHEPSIELVDRLQRRLDDLRHPR
jgi:hypothetical protein